MYHTTMFHSQKAFTIIIVLFQRLLQGLRFSGYARFVHFYEQILLSRSVCVLPTQKRSSTLLSCYTVTFNKTIQINVICYYSKHLFIHQLLRDFPRKKIGFALYLFRVYDGSFPTFGQTHLHTK